MKRLSITHKPFISNSLIQNNGHQVNHGNLSLVKIFKTQDTTWNSPSVSTIVLTLDNPSSWKDLVRLKHTCFSWKLTLMVELSRKKSIWNFTSATCKMSKSSINLELTKANSVFFTVLIKGKKFKCWVTGQKTIKMFWFLIFKGATKRS